MKTSIIITTCLALIGLPAAFAQAQYYNQPSHQSPYSPNAYRQTTGPNNLFRTYTPMKPPSPMASPAQRRGNPYGGSYRPKVDLHGDGRSYYHLPRCGDTPAC